MNAIEKVINKLVRLPGSMEKVIGDSLQRNRGIVEEIQAEQMRLGKDSRAAWIGDLRSPAYARRKKARGGDAPFGKVDLRDTGAFQRGIKMRIANKAIFFDSSDPKTPDLEDKYGDDIFGLNEVSIQKMKERFLVQDLQFEIKRFIYSA